MGRGIGNRQKKIVAPKKVWIKPRPAPTAFLPSRPGGGGGRPRPFLQSRPRPKVAPREASGRQDRVRRKRPSGRKNQRIGVASPLTLALFRRKRASERGGVEQEPGGNGGVQGIHRRAHRDREAAGEGGGGGGRQYCSLRGDQE